MARKQDLFNNGGYTPEGRTVRTHPRPERSDVLVATSESPRDDTEKSRHPHW